MSFLDFSCQKTYPGEFSRPEVILNRNYLRKCSISTVSWGTPSANLLYFKNSIKSEPLGVRD